MQNTKGAHAIERRACAVALILAASALLALQTGPARAQQATPPDPVVTPAEPAAETPAAPTPESVASESPESGAIESSAPEGAASPAEGSTRALDEEIQGIKQEVVDLNRELFVLEEELLFPANTQVAVFLSMDVGDFFALDAVQLKIDDKEVSNYLYTPREAEALYKGGVHRLYLGNLKVGSHELVAFFTGKGPNERDYKRGATLKFDKSVGAKYLELKISDRARRAQPEFEIKDWE